MGLSEEVVEDVRIHDRLAFELFAEHVALHPLATTLTFCQEEIRTGGTPCELATLFVLFDLKATGDERLGVAVDEMRDRLDQRTTQLYFKELPQKVWMLGEFVPQFRRVANPLSS